jgi:rubrerythrin
MLDSESQLREAIQKMLEPGKTAVAEQVVGQATSLRPAAEATTTYVCPMPEHVSIEYQHPGNCPLCGMTLVPVSTDLLNQLKPEPPVSYYTCPMLEHADVRMDKPGKCPKCGMTLIPVTKASEAPASKLPAPSAEYYTCPMHSDVHMDKPGKCPKCGMDLVPVMPPAAPAGTHASEMHDMIKQP